MPTPAESRWEPIVRRAVSGLGEILEENSRLREMVLERDGRLAAQAEKSAR